jgi:hypothetical protein
MLLLGLLRRLVRFFNGLCVPVSVFLGMRRGGTISIAYRLNAKTHPQLIGYVLIDGARVRQFFRHTQFRKKFQNQMGLHLQLPRKHVNTDFLHKQTKCKRGDS